MLRLSISEINDGIVADSRLIFVHVSTCFLHSSFNFNANLCDICNLIGCITLHEIPALGETRCPELLGMSSNTLHAKVVDQSFMSWCINKQVYMENT